MSYPLGVVTYASGPTVSPCNFERTDSFSIETWFYQTGDRIATFVSRMGAGPQNRGWMSHTVTSRGKVAGAAFYLVSDNAAGNYISVTAALPSWNLPINAWYHLVFTYNGSSQASGVRVYFNAVSKPLTIAANNLTDTIKSDTNKFRVGTGPFYPYFPGRLDEFVAYKRVLSAAEVVQRYNAGAGTETLFGAAELRFQMNQSSGTLVPDDVGGRDGQTINGPSWGAGKLNNAIYLNGSSQYVEA